MEVRYSYEEVIDTIQNSRRFGNLTGSEITKIMLEILKHPEEGMSYIHVAGTNGKGSVSNMLASVLAAAGFKVGLYTSPHILDFRERMRVVDNDGVRMVSKEYIWDFV